MKCKRTSRTEAHWRSEPRGVQVDGLWLCRVGPLIARLVSKWRKTISKVIFILPDLTEKVRHILLGRFFKAFERPGRHIWRWPAVI